MLIKEAILCSLVFFRLWKVWYFINFSYCFSMTYIMFHQRSTLQFPDTLFRCLKFPLQVEVGFAYLLADNCWSCKQESSFGKPKEKKKTKQRSCMSHLIDFRGEFFLNICFSYVNVMFCKSIIWLTHMWGCNNTKDPLFALRVWVQPIAIRLLDFSGVWIRSNWQLRVVANHLGSQSVPRLKPVSSKCWSLH